MRERHQVRSVVDDVVDKRPMKEVLRDLVRDAHTLNKLDDDISKLLRQTQELFLKLRPIGHPVDVAFPPWGKLGWTGRRGRWRLVVVDDEECEDLLNMPRQCRAEACSLLGKLAERMGLLDAKSR